MAAMVGYGRALESAGQVAEATELLASAREEYGDLNQSVEYVRMSAELARAQMLSGDPAEALRLVDETLPAAERLELARETLNLIITRGPALGHLGRPREAIVALVGAVAAAASHGLPDVEMRARVNLSYTAAAEDPQLGHRVARDGLEIARRLGFRSHGFYLLGNAAEMAMRMGDWEWAVARLEEAVAVDELDVVAELRLAQIRGMRGVDVEAMLARHAAQVADMTEVQAPATVSEAQAIVALARGEFVLALELAQASYRLQLSPDGQALQVAARAGAWVGDAEAVREAIRLLEDQQGRVPAATAGEARAALAALDGRRAEALAGFTDTLRRWRELGMELEVAMCGLDLVTLLGASEPAARSAADEAAAFFERVGAKPFGDLLSAALRAPRMPVAQAAAGGNTPTVHATSD
jgi:tetratricopeptide (TPR) repeat protein